MTAPILTALAVKPSSRREARTASEHASDRIEWQTEAMSPGDGMSPGTRMKKECETWLRGLVPGDETVVAVGTAEELRSLGSDIGSGGGWTFIVATSDRLLFARWGSRHKSHEEIRINDVTQWASGTQYNCEALVLTHPPMTRRQRVTAHKILWFEWGNAEADVTRTQTVFRFSRPDTQVTKALHSALSARKIAHEPLHFEERSREERTRGSRAVLHAKK
jgi:hypothetical protein